MKKLFLIPVRSGSQRIKDKNIQKLGDKTLLEIALLKLVDNDIDILISSDSLNYFEHAENFFRKYSYSNSIKFHKRTKNSSSNSATLEDVLDEILEDSFLVENYNDIFVHQCTSPFINKKTIRKLIKIYSNEKLDSIFTTVESHSFFWKKKNNINEYMPCFNNVIPRASTNDIEKIHIETGSLYGFNISKYLIHRRRTFGRTLPFDLQKLEALDIDNKEDLDLARFLYPFFENQIFK